MKCVGSKKLGMRGSKRRKEVGYGNLKVSGRYRVVCPRVICLVSHPYK
jgi:hypothetical protein